MGHHGGVQRLPRLVEGILKDPGRVRDVNSIMDAERRAAEEEVSDTLKAALVISRADKQQHRKLKDELANNYLLGTDQYPDTFDKAVRTLGSFVNLEMQHDGKECWFWMKKNNYFCVVLGGQKGFAREH